MDKHELTGKPNKWISYGIPVLWIPALALSFFGIVFVYSASCIYASQKFGDEFFFVKRQAFFLIPAILAGLIGLKTPLEFIDKHIGKLFSCCILLVLLTQVPYLGKKVGGASRWLALGPIRIQPSEFLKITTILFTTLFLSRWKTYIPKFLLRTSLRTRFHFLSRYARPLTNAFYICAILIAIIAIERQPDYGSTFVLIISLLSVVYLYGIPKRYFLGILGILIPLGTIALLTQKYRVARIMSFIDPYADPLGKGFQVIQSFVAVANGGLFGQGLGESKQKLFFLPEAHTDFILAVVAEEMGFIGISVVTILYLILYYAIFKVVLNAVSHREKLLAGGFFAMLVVITLINMGVVSGSIPNKGLPLPFISNGGSALIGNFFIIGLLAQLTRRIFDRNEELGK